MAREGLAERPTRTKASLHDQSATLAAFGATCGRKKAKHCAAVVQYVTSGRDGVSSVRRQTPDARTDAEGRMDQLRSHLQRGHPPILLVSGEIDIATVDQFTAALEDGVSVGSDVVVDMGEVTFIDASGLRTLLRVAESMNGSAPLVVVNAPHVAKLFGVVGLADTAPIDFREAE